MKEVAKESFSGRITGLLRRVVEVGSGGKQASGWVKLLRGARW